MYRGGPEPGLTPETEAQVQSEALLTGSYPSHLNRPGCLLHNGNQSRHWPLYCPNLCSLGLEATNELMTHSGVLSNFKVLSLSSVF